MLPARFAAPFDPAKRESLSTLRATATRVRDGALVALGVLGTLVFTVVPIAFLIAERVPLGTWKSLVLVPVLLLFPALGVLGLRNLLRRPAVLPANAIEISDGTIRLIGRRFTVESHPAASVSAELGELAGQPVILFRTPKGKRSVALDLLVDPAGTLAALGLVPPGH